MTGQRTARAVEVLRWTVGLVVLLESQRTFSGALSRMHNAGPAGTLGWVRLGLSGPEMLAALLFLVPFTVRIGGYALLLIIGLAIVIHGLHGEFGGLEILVLYGVAVFVSLVWRQEFQKRFS